MTAYAAHVMVPASLWLSANGRLHWAAAAERTRGLRHLGALAARQAGLRGARLGRVRVAVEVHRPRRGRTDATNATPTVKAVLDGFTDAHVWDDDDDTHIISTTYVAGEPTGRTGIYSLTITITEERP